MRDLEKNFLTMDSSLMSGIFIDVVIAMAFGASMRWKWGLINTLQIMTHATMLE
jgi:hypothetical protein